MPSFRIYIKLLFSFWQGLVSFVLFVVTIFLYIYYAPVSEIPTIELLQNNQEIILPFAPILWIVTFGWANYLAYKNVSTELSEYKSKLPKLKLLFKDNSEKISLNIQRVSQVKINDYCDYLLNLWNDYENLYISHEVGFPERRYYLEQDEQHKDFVQNKKVFLEYIEKTRDFLEAVYRYCVEISNSRVYTINIVNCGKFDSQDSKLVLTLPSEISIYNKEYYDDLVNRLDGINPPPFPKIDGLEQFMYYSSGIPYNLLKDKISYHELRFLFGESIFDSFESIQMSKRDFNLFNKSYRSGKTTEISIPSLTQTVGKFEIMTALIKVNDDMLRKLNKQNETKGIIDIPYEIYEPSIPGGIKDKLQIEVNLISD